MEAGADDISGLLPLVGGAWPTEVEEILQSIKDDSVSGGGDSLFRRILKMREHVAPGEHLAEDAGLGLALYLDDLLPPENRRRWFEETLPSLAGLLLDFPSLLSAHFRLSPRHLRLRILPAQRPGAVLVSQRLVAALVACSFFCLFPVRRRRDLRLPPVINLDSLFHSLYQSGSLSLEHKLHCLLHYFRRATSSSSGAGAVSFHRKVVPSPAPPPSFWSRSNCPLCVLEVHTRGFIEDHPVEALQVDFANQYLGGGALNWGCVQEEIRFMINPELIAGMIILPRMHDNEAIEVVGAERFSNYTGYASSFRFAGDHVDTTAVDSANRRRTRIIAIDALCNPGMRQYKLDFILRETNKAFCGFSDQIESEHLERLFSGSGPQQALRGHSDEDGNHTDAATMCDFNSDESPSTSVAIGREDEELTSRVAAPIGIATGNWGCGAFGGDPELKAMIQWLAASQAIRPVIAYYTFDIKELRNLEQASQWILLHKWTVGDLWNILVEYSSQRHKGVATMGFFAWLLPFLNSSHETQQLRHM